MPEFLRAAIEGEGVIVRTLLPALCEWHRRAALDQENPSPPRQRPLAEQHTGYAASEDAEVCLPLTPQGGHRKHCADRGALDTRRRRTSGFDRRSSGR